MTSRHEALGKIFRCASMQDFLGTPWHCASCAILGNCSTELQDLHAYPTSRGQWRFAAMVPDGARTLEIACPGLAFIVTVAEQIWDFSVRSGPSLEQLSSPSCRTADGTVAPYSSRAVLPTPSVSWGPPAPHRFHVRRVPHSARWCGRPDWAHVSAQCSTHSTGQCVCGLALPVSVQ